MHVRSSNCLFAGRIHITAGAYLCPSLHKCASEGPSQFLASGFSVESPTQRSKKELLSWGSVGPSPEPQLTNPLLLLLSFPQL